MRKRSWARGKRKGKRANERASKRTGGAGKKKARTHQGAEIKKREQAGGKNSRFGICVSEAGDNDADNNGGTPMSHARCEKKKIC